MNTVTKQKYEELYAEYEKAKYIGFVSELSSVSTFDDDTWICDKRQKSKAQIPSKLSIYFGRVNKQYKEMLKVYAV